MSGGSPGGNLVTALRCVAVPIRIFEQHHTPERFGAQALCFLVNRHGSTLETFDACLAAEVCLVDIMHMLCSCSKVHDLRFRGLQEHMDIGSIALALPKHLPNLTTLHLVSASNAQGRVAEAAILEALEWFEIYQLVDLKLEFEGMTDAVVETISKMFPDIEWLQLISREITQEALWDFVLDHQYTLKGLMNPYYERWFRKRIRMDYLDEDAEEITRLTNILDWR